MAQKVLIMGESGTGKSTSLRNVDPTIMGIVNPVGKPLPFKGKIDTLDDETDATKICKWMRKQVDAGKKVLVVDDFQYILSVPYMNRIQENGWDKWNDFGANYFDIIDICKELPDDVVVYYLTHTETLENGVTTIKLIGKLLREKITIEGLFTIVLRTGVNEGRYYFYTQNSGKDTVKSPMGMFPSYAIENDLKYVDDKIRNYYEIGEFKSDSEMAVEDAAVATDLEKPNANGRRSRKKAAPKDEGAEPEKTTRTRRSRAEVQASNEEKMAQYQQDCDAAVQEKLGDKEEVDFDEHCEATKEVPQPEMEKLPRRTRKERKVSQDAEVCKADTYFYIEADDNYVMKHKGDPIPEGAKKITKKEFGEGVKRLAQQESDATDTPVEDMDSSKAGRRTRRVQTKSDSDNQNDAEPEKEDATTVTRTRRTRRTRL